MKEIKGYMLNRVSAITMFEAHNEDEATLLFLNDFFSETFETLEIALEKWEKHCEAGGYDDRIEWKEYEKEFEDESKDSNDFTWSIVKKKKIDNMKNKEQEPEYLGTTIGMMAFHESLKKSYIVRCQFYKKHGIIELHAVDEDLERLESIETVFMFSDEYNDRDFSHTDDSVEWLWAMKKLDFVFEDDEIQE